MGCFCGAVPSSMRLIEENEEKQGQWGEKKENQFRKLLWRTLPPEGLWVFILHTLLGIKHFIREKQNAYFHTNDIIYLQMWYFMCFWNKFILFIWLDCLRWQISNTFNSCKTMYSTLVAHVCLYLENPSEEKFMLFKEKTRWDLRTKAVGVSDTDHLPIAAAVGSSPGYSLADGRGSTSCWHSTGFMCDGGEAK